MPLIQFFRMYGDQDWYGQIARHLNTSYETAAGRLLQSFQFVTPETDNRYCYSYTFSSILRDIGSTFDSVLRELIRDSGATNIADNILGHLDFLKSFQVDLEELSVGFDYNFKTVLPFERSRNNPPSWWTAYNDVKHDEVVNRLSGNLENAVKALASLAVLRDMICENHEWRVFHNVGIHYPPDDPSVSENNKLFPTT